MIRGVCSGTDVGACIVWCERVIDEVYNRDSFGADKRTGKQQRLRIQSAELGVVDVDELVKRAAESIQAVIGEEEEESS